MVVSVCQSYVRRYDVTKRLQAAEITNQDHRDRKIKRFNKT